MVRFDDGTTTAFDRRLLSFQSRDNFLFIENYSKLLLLASLLRFPVSHLA